MNVKKKIKGKIRDKEKKNDQDVSLKEKLTEALELPKEVVLNVPKITMVGSTNLVIENYKGVIEYDSSRIRINTGVGMLKMSGMKLVIKEITSEIIVIAGKITSVEIME